MARHPGGGHQQTLGADKNHNAKGFVAERWRIGVTPYLVQISALPGCLQGVSTGPNASNQAF